MPLEHLTRRLVDEQLLPGADLVRRRALGNVGAKIIREARRNLGLESISTRSTGNWCSSITQYISPSRSAETYDPAGRP